MNKDQALALARRMQEELPGTQIERFPAMGGEFTVYAKLPSGVSVTVFNDESWENEKASFEAFEEFKKS